MCAAVFAKIGQPSCRRSARADRGLPEPSIFKRRGTQVTEHDSLKHFVESTVIGTFWDVDQHSTVLIET